MTDAATTDSRLAPQKFPARSKMLDMYAGDIVWTLAAGRFDSAEKLALAIPHVGVALSDASLQSSREGYLGWCARWVDPSFDARVFEDWCHRSAECTEGPAVPFGALRELRLRRRAREVPPPPVQVVEPADARERDVDALSRALMRALRRWYEQEGRGQESVQINLARLGVLR